MLSARNRLASRIEIYLTVMDIFYIQMRCITIFDQCHDSLEKIVLTLARLRPMRYLS